MNKKLAALGLAIRIFLAWWLVPTLLFSLLGGVELGGCLAFFLFPLVAIAAATYGTWAQYNHCRTTQGLGAFHHTFIQVPTPRGEVEGTVATLLQESLAATSLSVRGHRLHAVFQPPVWSGWWRRWTMSDEVIVEVQATDASEAGGCTLEVWARPLSRLAYGFLWVDLGRNHRRLCRFQEALTEHLVEANLRKEAAWKSDSLEGRLAQAELMLLRAQVEPHFLFNTLAHLREMIRSGDMPASMKMLDHLIAYSRSVSDRIRQSTHHLGQELEAIQGYLSLMQIRFGDRLRFDIQVDPEIQDCDVPVGCLLIPVENAIKHGIEPRATPGLVSIRGYLEGGALHLEVQDDGPGLSMDSGFGPGTGLANLRERLKLLYSDSARLLIEGHEAGGVLVRLVMPVLGNSAP